MTVRTGLSDTLRSELQAPKARLKPRLNSRQVMTSVSGFIRLSLFLRDFLEALVAFLNGFACARGLFFVVLIQRVLSETYRFPVREGERGQR